MRSNRDLFRTIVERSYLVDPKGTDADLREMGRTELASELQHDHRMGRIAEHHANMTGKRVIVERIPAERTASSRPTMAGAVMSPSTKESRE